MNRNHTAKMSGLGGLLRVAASSNHRDDDERPVAEARAILAFDSRG